jgi:hypothetical protein
MSNRYTGRIIVIDTTDTQVGGITDTNFRGPLPIKAIKWVGTQNSAKDIAQNDDLTIRLPDASGSIVIEARAQGSSPNQEAYSVEFGGKPWIVDGLYVEDLDGGELQIFLE